MTTTTTFLGLTVDSTSDNFSTSQIAGNWAILDGAPGVYVCTSTSRPSLTSGQAGRLIYETDSTLIWQWNGTAWVRPFAIGQVGAASTSSGSAITSTTQTTILSGTYSVPAGGRYIKISANIPSASVSGGFGTFGIYIDGTLYASVPVNIVTTAIPFNFSVRSNSLATGNHTFVLSGNVNSTSNTLTLVAGAHSQIGLTVEEV